MRFSNIRSACALISRPRMGSRGWSVDHLTAREFSQVGPRMLLARQQCMLTHFQIVAPASGYTTCHEGQLYLTVFPHGLEIPNDLKQLEISVKSILQGEGDLFAFKLQPGVEGSLLSAVVEYCENDVSLKVVSNLNGRVVRVSTRVQFTLRTICLLLIGPPHLHGSISS